MSSTNYNYWGGTRWKVLKTQNNGKSYEGVCRRIPGSHQGTIFTLLLPIRKVTDRLRLFLMKPPTMKRNMQKVLQISSWGVERWAACFNYDKCRLPCGLRKHFGQPQGGGSGGKWRVDKALSGICESCKRRRFWWNSGSFHKNSRSWAKAWARYKKLAENIENNKVFNKDEKVLWKCRNCGYVHEGNSAPENVRHVLIQKHFSKCWQKIINFMHIEIYIELEIYIKCCKNK